MRLIKRTQLSIVLILVVGVMSMIILANRQLVYGGYEGVFLKSVERVMLSEVLDVTGDLRIRGQMEDLDDEGLDLLLFFKGSVEPQLSQGNLQFYTMIGDRVSKEEIGSLVVSKYECRVESELMSEVLVIPIGEVLEGWGKDCDYNEAIKNFYEGTTVESVIVDDQRPGYTQLKQRVIRYKYINDTLTLLMHINESAVITDIEVIVEIDQVTVDASIVFKYDVYGG